MVGDVRWAVITIPLGCVTQRQALMSVHDRIIRTSRVPETVHPRWRQAVVLRPPSVSPSTLISCAYGGTSTHRRSRLTVCHPLSRRSVCSGRGPRLQLQRRLRYLQRSWVIGGYHRAYVTTRCMTHLISPAHPSACCSHSWPSWQAGKNPPFLTKDPGWSLLRRLKTSTDGARVFNAGLLARSHFASGRSCDRPTRARFSVVFLGLRANAELVPKFHVALHASHAALPMVITKFALMDPSWCQIENHSFGAPVKPRGLGTKTYWLPDCRS
jgi:hypothetical protein